MCADRRVWGPRLPHLFGTHRPGLHSVAQLAAAPHASSSFELRSSTLLAALSHAAGGLRLSLEGMPDQRQALPQAGPAARWPSLLPQCASHYSHARVHTSGGAQKACTFNGSTCLLRHGLCGLRAAAWWAGARCNQLHSAPTPQLPAAPAACFQAATPAAQAGPGGYGRASLLI